MLFCGSPRKGPALPPVTLVCRTDKKESGVRLPLLFRLLSRLLSPVPAKRPASPPESGAMRYGEDAFRAHYLPFFFVYCNTLKFTPI